MMPLPDVYCLFNRARGAELVSPDDLLAAVKLFPAIGAPFTVGWREAGASWDGMGWDGMGWDGMGTCSGQLRWDGPGQAGLV